MLEESSITSKPVERPGCVTFYAVLLVLGGGISMIGALIFLLGFSIAGLETADISFLTAGFFGGGYLLILAVLSIFSAVGIWGMKKWGWWLVVVTQIISLVSAISQPILQTGSDDGGFATSVSCAALGPVIVLIWFIRNRHLFGV